MNKIPPPPPKTLPPQRPTSDLFGEVSQTPSGHRVVIYGPGGIGKTTLACRAPGPVAYVDAEDSLGVLRKNLTEQGIAIPMVVNVKDFKSLREALARPSVWDKFKTIVIEITRVEEWCVNHTLATVKGEKGKKCDKLEDYGYGKGYQHVYEDFLPLLSDLDRHARAGRNVILIAHDCVKTVPNPSGEDWIRWEPRLQDPSTGKSSIKLRVKEWADHVLFYSYDVVADEDKKAQGQGTKTIYSSELPHFIAKSRTFSGGRIDVTDSVDVWGHFLN